MRRRLVAAGIVLAAPVLLVLTYFVCRPFLPSRIRGASDFVPAMSSPTPPVAVLVGALAVSLPAAVISTIRILRGSQAARRNALTGMGTFVAWLMAMSGIAAFVTSAGAADYAEARGRWWSYPIWIFGMLAVGAVSVWLVPLGRADQAALPVPPSTITLSEGERLAWDAPTTRPELVIWLPLAAASVILAFVWIPAAIVLTALGCYRLATDPVRLMIDQRGVSVRPRLGRMHLVAPIGSIESVEVVWRRRAEDWWEWNLGDRRLLNQRPGPALVVHLGCDEEILVALPDAAAASDVMNALLARLREQVRTA